MTTFILLCAVTFGGKPDPIFSDTTVANSVAVNTTMPTAPGYTPSGPRQNSLPPANDPAFTALNRDIGTYSRAPTVKDYPLFGDDRFIVNKDEWEKYPFNLVYTFKKHGHDAISLKVKWKENNEGKIFYARPKVGEMEDIVNPSSLQFKSVNSPLELILQIGEPVVIGKQDMFAALAVMKAETKRSFEVKFAQWSRWGFQPYVRPAHVRTKNHSDFRR